MCNKPLEEWAKKLNGFVQRELNVSLEEAIIFVETTITNAVIDEQKKKEKEQEEKEIIMRLNTLGV